MTVDLQPYDSNNSYHKLCLLHNFSTQAFSPLKRKTRKQKNDTWKIPTDDYPVSFLENVYSLATDAIRAHTGNDDPVPCPKPTHMRLLEDILEDLTTEELTFLTSKHTDHEEYGVLNKVEHVYNMTLLEPLLVTNKAVKYFMNWLNSKPKGTILDFGSHPVRAMFHIPLRALQLIREIYFPNKVFEKCHVFRGVVNQQLSVLQANGSEAVIVMWKKNDSKKRLLAATINFLDFRSFDPEKWSIIVYYNVDGTTGGSRVNSIDKRETSTRSSNSIPPDSIPPTPRSTFEPSTPVYIQILTFQCQIQLIDQYHLMVH